MSVLKRLEKSKGFWFLLTTSLLFFILRFPSLFEPYWYGDEGVYQTLGLAIRSGRLLYRDIWDNKPPLLYSLYSVFNSDQFSLRLVSIIFGVATVIVFYHLSKRIFNKSKTTAIATLLFALLFSLPLLEGNIANAENFMLFPIVSAALVIIKLKESASSASQSKNLYLIFSSGLLLGIAFLFKIVAVFDFSAFLFFLILADKNIVEHVKNKNYLTFEVKKLIYFAAGFSFLPALTAIFFLMKDGFVPFLKATFFSNIGYVGYGNSLLIPQGFLLLKIFSLIGFTYYLFRKRKVFDTGTVFILLWFAFSLFNTFFSQRPYTHYLLTVIAPFSLLIGLVIESARYRLFLSALALISFLIVVRNFNFYIKIVPYYANFLSFIKGEKSASQYQDFFDPLTPVDYKLASYINSHTKPDDYIFTWGNNAQLYKLTNKLPPGRFTVAYHVTGMQNGIKETSLALKSKNPKVIVVMPYMNNFPFSLSNYAKKIIINGASIYERSN